MYRFTPPSIVLVSQDSNVTENSLLASPLTVLRVVYVAHCLASLCDWLI